MKSRFPLHGMSVDPRQTENVELPYLCRALGTACPTFRSWPTKPGEIAGAGKRSTERRPADKYRITTNKTIIVAAWLALLVSALHPARGLGFTICPLRACTGIPCPGCGLTRSLSCHVRGMFIEGWHNHPLGIVFLAMAIVIAVLSVLPRDVRNRVEVVLGRFSRLTSVAGILFVAAFLGHGIWRAIDYIVSC